MQLDFNIYKPALERWLQAHLYLNEKLRPWIISLERLINVNASEIHVNLKGLNSLYTDRYFSGRVESMCLVMFETLFKPALISFLKKTNYDAQGFKITFQLGAEEFKKSFVIFSNGDNG